MLAGVDAVVMVLDTAKGIEAQTLKLFEVCRARRLPVLTFLNKYDRPGREPLELLDEIEAQIGLRPTPVTWPVGIAGDLRGVVDRRTGEYIRFTRTDRGASLVARGARADRRRGRRGGPGVAGRPGRDRPARRRRRRPRPRRRSSPATRRRCSSARR